MPPYLIVHDYMQVNGGAERLVLTLARGLPGSRLAASGIYPDFSGSADTHGVRIEEWGGPAPWLPRVPRALLSFGRIPPRMLDAPAVVYSGVYAPLAVGRQPAGRRIYYCHTPPRFAFDMEDEYLLRAPVPLRPLLKLAIARYRQAYLRAVRTMDVVLTNSEHVRQRLHRQTGIAARVVYPPIDTGSFAFDGQDNYYLSVGRLEPNKRIDRIVRAFLGMPDKKLVVASGGSQAAALRALAGQAPNIHFTGWIDDTQLARWMSKAIAAIYIPRDEDFGMSTIEAMAAGKPVVGVNEGGLRETITDGETGIMLPPDPSVEAIATGVRRLDSGTAAAMRPACEARADSFSAPRFVAACQRAILDDDVT